MRYFEYHSSGENPALCVGGGGGGGGGARGEVSGPENALSPLL